MKSGLNWLKWVTLSSFVFASMGVAEEAAVTAVTPSTSAEVQAVPAPQAGVLTGFVDIRPTFTFNGETLGTENEVELGYKFNPNTTLAYRHQINTNISTPGGGVGLNPTSGAGIIRAAFSNLTVTADNVALGYEGRLYLPFATSVADAGGVVAMRNYFKLTKTFDNGMKLGLWEVPIIHVFDRAIAPSGKANAAFENRLYLVGEAQFGDFSVTLPLWWTNVKMRDAAGSWTGGLFIAPEVGYAINSNLSVGVSYYNNLGFFSESKGELDSSAIQAVITATL